MEEQLETLRTTIYGKEMKEAIVFLFQAQFDHAMEIAFDILRAVNGDTYNISLSNLIGG